MSIIGDEQQKLDENALPGAYSDFSSLIDRSWYRPVRGGCDIAFYETAGGHAGALGALVKKNSDQSMCFLTAAHVARATNQNIYQPRTRNQKNVIGLVDSRNDTLDAAIIKISDGVEYCNWIVGIGPVTGSYTVRTADLPFPVQMRGPVTGYQYGFVTGVDGDGTLTLDLKGDSGDSGSALVDESGRLIGIFLGFSAAGFLGRSIDKIMQTFNVSVVIDNMPPLLAVREQKGNAGWLKYSYLEAGNWSSSQLFPMSEQNFRSSGPPAIAAFSSKSELLYCVHEDMGNRGDVFGSTFDGTGFPTTLKNWSGDRLFPYAFEDAKYQTTGSPAMAVFRGRLFVMRQDGGNSANLRLASFDGNFWSDTNSGITTSDSTEGAPALAVFNNKLNVVRIVPSGGYGDDTLWWATWDGSNWNDTVMLALGDSSQLCESSGPVALAVYKNELYCFWEGIGDNNGYLQGAKLAHGTSQIWNRLDINEKYGVSGPPAAIAYNNVLYCIREGRGNEGKLWSLQYDGSNWTDQRLPSDSDPYDSTGRPALAIFPKRTTVQSNWFYCTQCHGLFILQVGFSGVCPKDGSLGAHTPISSPIQRYNLAYDSDIGGQSGWRKCLKCNGLFLYANGAAGVCPAALNHGSHFAGSAVYNLVFDTPNYPGEKDWSFCGKCRGLYRTSGGVCPAGGDHEHTALENYSLLYEAK